MPRPHRPARLLLTVAAATAGALVLRHRGLRWGADQVELSVLHPGDELLPDADLVATRATTVRAPADRVWPWLVQMGQGRGGFYSYDALENLVGLQIRSADVVEPRWQDLAVGDHVHLAPQVALEVARLDRDRAMVLRGAGPALPDEDAAPYDFTWAFLLRPGREAGTTRLVVRERYRYREPWARWAVEPLTLVSLVMTARMLRGIRDRAER